ARPVVARSRAGETGRVPEAASVRYGEGGIRTHGTPLEVHAISSRAHSTTLAPLHGRRARQTTERVGFEPTVPYQGTHDFESCAFNRTRPPLPLAAVYRSPEPVARTGRRARKKRRSSSAASPASTPARTSIAWLSSRTAVKSSTEPAAPALGARAA